jgi:hypothetical protein
LVNQERQKLKDAMKIEREAFDQEKAYHKMMMEQEYEELENEKLKWRNEKEKIDLAQMNNSELLTLNVSGITAGFTLPRKLLTSVKGSGLEAMFNGRHEL